MRKSYKVIINPRSNNDNVEYIIPLEKINTIANCSRIINVELVMKGNSNDNIINFTYNGTVVDAIKFNGNVAYLNIMDIILNSLENSCITLYSSVANISECYMQIEYEYCYSKSDNSLLIKNTLKDVETVYNAFDNNTEFIYTDMKLKSKSLEIELSHYFNSKRSQKVFLEGDVVDLNNEYYGKGVSTSMSSRIIRKKGTDKYYFVDHTNHVLDFDNKYYYIVIGENGEEIRKQVNKNDVTIKPDGSLWYQINNTQYPVKTKLKTKSGLTISYPKEDFKEIEYYEQRRDEVAQLEEENKDINKAINDLEYEKESLNNTISDLNVRAEIIAESVLGDETKNIKSDIDNQINALKEIVGKIDNAVKTRIDLENNKQNLEYEKNNIIIACKDIPTNDDIQKMALDLEVAQPASQDIYVYGNCEERGSGVSSYGTITPEISQNIKDLNELKKNLFGVIEKRVGKTGDTNYFIKKKLEGNTYEDFYRVPDDLINYLEPNGLYSLQGAKQLYSLCVRYDALLNQITQIINNVESINKDILNLNVQKENINFNLKTNYDYIGYVEENINNIDSEYYNTYMAEFTTFASAPLSFESEVEYPKNRFNKAGVHYQLYDIAKQKQQCTDLQKRYDDKIKDYQDRVDKNIKLLSNYYENTPEVFIKNNNIVYSYIKTTSLNDGYDIYKLYSINDYKENLLLVKYSNDKIIAISNGKEDIAVFNYLENGLLGKIKYKSGKEISYSYSNDYITKIDTKVNKYSFTYQNNQLKEVGYNDIRKIVNDISTIQVTVRNQIRNGFVISKTAENQNEYIYYDIDAVELNKNSHYSYQLKKYIREKIKGEENRALKVKEDINIVTDVYGQIISYVEQDTIQNIKQYNISKYDFQNKVYNIEVLRTDSNINITNTAPQYVSYREYEYYLGDKLENFSKGNREGVFLDYTVHYSDEQHRQYVLQGDVKTVMFNVDLSTLPAYTTDIIFKAVVKANSGFICNAINRFYNQEENIDCEDHCDNSRKFEVRAEVKYNNKEKVDTFIYKADYNVKDWQYLAVPIKLNSNDIEYIHCYIDYSNNLGDCEYKEVAMLEGKWDYHEYDENDNLTYSEYSQSDSIESYEYDIDDKLISSIITKDSKQIATYYMYDINDRLICKKSTDGMIEKTIVAEDDKVERTVVYNIETPASKYYQEVIYDDERKVIAEVDSLGDYNNIEYSYNEDKIASVKDANGNTVGYGYDANENLVHKTSTVNGVNNEVISNYKHDKIVELVQNDMSIKYEYDMDKDSTSVKIGDDKVYLSTETSGDNSHTMFASGEIIDSVYDETKFTTRVKYYASAIAPEESLSTIQQDRYGQILSKIDKVDGLVYNENNRYNKFGDVEYSEVGQTKIVNQYDNHRHLISQNVQTLDSAYSITYDYDELYNRINSVNIWDATQRVQYDKLGRVISITTDSLEKRRSYLQNGDHTTDIPAELEQSINGIIVDKKRYIYDKLGNIERVYSSGVEKVRYWYDNLNRLIREDNRDLAITYTIDYDRSGNIINKTSYPYTITDNLDYSASSSVEYNYRSNGWRDQLMVYNGQQIQYDSIGNPTTHNGKNLIWHYIRQLRKIGDNIEYGYNADGVRQRKTVNGIVTDYQIVGDKLLSEKRGEDTKIHYLHGVDGLFAFEYNGERYTYIRNLLGDVEYILDNDCNKVAKYVYDAWGNHKVYSADNILIYDSKTGVVESYENHIGNINPIRYRGYYYDIESGLYYLTSRYYDPQIGRFINADDISYLDPENINGLNLYAYCGNNPVMYEDPSGHMPSWLKWLCVGVVAVAAVAAVVVGTVVTGGTLGAVIAGAGVGAIAGGTIGGINAAVNGDDVASGILGGALTGAAVGATGALGGVVGTGIISGGSAMLAFCAGVGSSFIAGMGNYAIETMGNNRSFSVGKMFLQGTLTAVEGAIGFGMGVAFASAGLWDRINRRKGSKVSFIGGSSAMKVSLSAIRFFFTKVFAKGPTFPLKKAFL